MPAVFSCAVLSRCSLRARDPPHAARTQLDEEVERALAAARVKANAGDVVAQFSLGSMLYYGANDTAQAVDWFRKAAAQNYAPAEFQMGLLYDFGFGVGQSDSEALVWYRRAAEHGSAAGQRTVGDFYRKGRGVAVDLAEAARWYQRGADGDDIRAQYQLGDMYLNGTGVTATTCPHMCGSRWRREPGAAAGQPEAADRAPQHRRGADDARRSRRGRARRRVEAAGCVRGRAELASIRVRVRVGLDRQ